MTGNMFHKVREFPTKKKSFSDDNEHANAGGKNPLKKGGKFKLFFNQFVCFILMPFSALFSVTRRSRSDGSEYVHKR